MRYGLAWGIWLFVLGAVQSAALGDQGFGGLSIAGFAPGQSLAQVQSDLRARRFTYSGPIGCPEGQLIRFWEFHSAVESGQLSRRCAELLFRNERLIRIEGESLQCAGIRFGVGDDPIRCLDVLGQPWVSSRWDWSTWAETVPTTEAWVYRQGETELEIRAVRRGVPACSCLERFILRLL